MDSFNNEEITLGIARDRMVDIISAINNFNTGIEIMDNIVLLYERRIREQFDPVSAEKYIREKDLRPVPNDRSVVYYISILSDHGGLFKYVCETQTKIITRTNEENNQKKFQLNQHSYAGFCVVINILVRKN